MAFMHFGNFLEGMRLSAQDIADKEKAALNERYMNEQMETMQLSRRMNEDELGYRPETRRMEAEKFRMGEEQFANEQRARRIDAMRGEALAGLADVDLTSADALNRALAAHAEQANYNGIPAQYAGWTARDAKDGSIELVSPEGKAQRLDKRNASIFGHRLWNEVPEWLKAEREEKRARMSSGGGGTYKTSQYGAYTQLVGNIKNLESTRAQMVNDLSFIDKNVDPKGYADKMAKIQAIDGQLTPLRNELAVTPAQIVLAPDGSVRLLDNRGRDIDPYAATPAPGGAGGDGGGGGKSGRAALKSLIGTPTKSTDVAPVTIDGKLVEFKAYRSKDGTYRYGSDDEAAIKSWKARHPGKPAPRVVFADDFQIVAPPAAGGERKRYF